MNRTIFPTSVIIEPTDRCNLTCSYCPRRFLEGKGGYMDLDLFKKVIDEVESYWGTKVVLFHRGESLLHPDLLKMVEYAFNRVKEVELATNAVLLSEAKAEVLGQMVDFISFSIDTPGRFAEHRGGADYEKVRQNIEWFLSRSTRSKTQVSMVATEDTVFGDIMEFNRLWWDKVDRIRIYEEHSQSGEFGSLRGNRGKRRPCVKPLEQMVVSWDGAIRRCNHDWDGKPLGFLRSTTGENDGATLKGIWNGPRYGALREQQQALEFTDKTCGPCGSWYPGGIEAGTGWVFEKAKAQ